MDVAMKHNARMVQYGMIKSGMAQMDAVLQQTALVARA